MNPGIPFVSARSVIVQQYWTEEAEGNGFLLSSKLSAALEEKYKSDFGDDVTPEVTILRVPKVTTRRNVVFCVDKGGKLIVVCLVTMMKVFEWKKVRMMFGFCLRRLAVQP